MEYIIQDSTLQSIADAIRSKTGDTAPIQTDAFANAISLIETGGGGDTSQEDGLVTRTLTEYTNSRVTEIGGSAFFQFITLKSVNFPAVTVLRNYAFTGCVSLETINLPKATRTGQYAFEGCKSLISVNFPMMEEVAQYTFANCTELTDVNLPMITSAGKYAFQSCSSLTNVTFPALSTINSSAFANCTALIALSLPAIANIYNYAFYNCTALTTLYLMNPSVCKLSNSNAFYNAGIKSTTGSIFVPASLLTAYQTATNWAYFSTQFVPIEE